MQTPAVDDVRPDFTGLADDSQRPGRGREPMRTRQRLVRALIAEIVVDIDEAAGEIVLVIHWKGGQLPSCASTSREPGNTGVAHPSRRSPSCGAWQADGRIRTSPRH